MSLFGSLRTIRKKPKQVRSGIFYMVAIVIIPVTIVVLFISFYQTIQNVSLNPGSSVQPPTFGIQARIYINAVFQKTLEGIGRVANTVRSFVHTINISDAFRIWMRTITRKPEVKTIPLPDQSGALFPVASSSSE